MTVWQRSEWQRNDLEARPKDIVEFVGLSFCFVYSHLASSPAETRGFFLSTVTYAKALKSDDPKRPKKRRPYG